MRSRGIIVQKHNRSDDFTVPYWLFSLRFDMNLQERIILSVVFEFQDKDPIKTSFREISRITGISRSYVARVLNKFERDEYIFGQGISPFTTTKIYKFLDIAVRSMKRIAEVDDNESIW